MGMGIGIGMGMGTGTWWETPRGAFPAPTKGSAKGSRDGDALARCAAPAGCRIWGCLTLNGD